MAENKLISVSPESLLMRSVQVHTMTFGKSLTANSVDGELNVGCTWCAFLKAQPNSTGQFALGYVKEKRPYLTTVDLQIAIRGYQNDFQLSAWKMIWEIIKI